MDHSSASNRNSSLFDSTSSGLLPTSIPSHLLTDSSIRTPSPHFRPRKFSSPLVAFPSFQLCDATNSPEETGLFDSGFSSSLHDGGTTGKLCPKYHNEGLCELGPDCPLIHEEKPSCYKTTSFNPTAPEFYPSRLHQNNAFSASPSVWSRGASLLQGGSQCFNEDVADLFLQTSSSNSNFSFEDRHDLLTPADDVMKDLEEKKEARRRLNPLKYKTEPCTTFHTIGSCPYGDRCFFYHQVEEKSRLKTKLKTRLCRSWSATGRCDYGQRCDFAHGCDELNIKFKTRMCKVFVTTGRCPYGPQCTFAHTVQERRNDISTVYKFKTELCQMWLKGECTFGPVCHFAHGAQELQTFIDYSP